VIDLTPFFADHDIVYAIQQWSRASDSRMLWVVGHPERYFPNSASSIAASIINSAGERKIPVVYVFCDWPGEDDENAIITMLYSLIRQVINSLPSHIDTSINLSRTHFQKLDGTIGTWNEGLSILSELLLHTPSLLLTVIDGIEHLDYLNIGQQYISSMLGLLQNHVSNTRERNIEVMKTSKVLFTTAGNCASLNEVDDQILTIAKASEYHGKHNPGKAGPGRAELPSLNDGITERDAIGYLSGWLNGSPLPG
jgi:hypothetical protein